MDSNKSWWLLFKKKVMVFCHSFKIKSHLFYENQVKISVYEIALAGILVGFFLISDRFINFDLGFMHVSIYYAFVILFGLVLKPVHAFFVAIIADTFGTLITVGFAQWMIEYAMIYPLMALIASLFRKLLDSKAKFLWVFFIFVNITVIIGTFVTMIVKNNFIKVSKNSESLFDFTSDVSKIVTSVMASLLVFVSIIFAIIYFLSQKHKIKLDAQRIKSWMFIYSLVIFLYIIFVWVWGPIAQIRYNSVYLNHLSFATNAKNSYELFLVARIFKTPFAVLVYTIIIMPVYESNRVVMKHFSISNKW